jgi:hypothetical protein
VNKSRECLYDVNWQVMRMRLHPRWASSQGANENLLELLAYVGKAADSYWKFVRIWRVQNLLNTVRVAYNALGKGGFREDIQVRKTLVGLEIEWHRLHSRQPLERKRDYQYNKANERIYPGPYRKWNWDKVMIDLRSLHEKDLQTFDHLMAISENRLIDVRKKQSALDIPELTKFVTLMRDIDFERGEA